MPRTESSAEGSTVPTTPTAPSAARPGRMPRPRNWDWEGQYIRRRHRRYQARPYAGGQRHYLGSFATYHDARRAVVKFFEGRVKPLPKFVRAVFADGRQCHSAADAAGFVGEIRTPLIRYRSPIFATREEAHAAAVAHLTALREHLRGMHAGVQTPPAVVAHLNEVLAHLRDLEDTQGDRRRPKRRPAPTVAQLAAPDDSTALVA